MAKEVMDTVRNNFRVNWTIRESVQALLRMKIKRLLCKYKYPPDKQEKATNGVGTSLVDMQRLGRTKELSN
jgi:type I restriction enzyme R subunit